MCVFLVLVSFIVYLDVVCRVSVSYGISCYWYFINNYFNEDV